ncbi:MAG: glycosyltransferase family 4 protein [Sedimentisphaerales bacterium]|nr:glycosyltransferase family 4 protein [Sedimentisphaerales bacterium]
MNFLIVTQYAVPHGGGLSAHVEDLIECMQLKGHNAELIEGRMAAPSKWSKGIYLLLAGGRNDNYRLSLLAGTIKLIARHTSRILNAKSIDLIHCHDPVACYAVKQVLDRMSRRIPIVETVHGPLTYESTMMLGCEKEQSRYLQRLWQIESEAYQSADRIIGVDTGQSRIVTDDFETDRAKVTTIFNSVSCAAIARTLEAGSSVEAPRPYMLVPRRLVEKTGVRFAVEALSLIAEETGLNLVIAGEGPLRPQLSKFAEDLGIGSRVIFLGSIPRNEVLYLAKNALAVIVPSIPSCGVVEATSIAALEAMACGTVVIASDIGGLAELVENGRTGFLVPHSNARALADVMKQLCDNDDLEAGIGRNSYEHILNNLDRPIWFSKVSQVYDKALEGSSR